MSLVAGCFAGILGVTGYKGFVVYVISHLALGLCISFKAGFHLSRYFTSPWSMFYSGIGSQTEILTFILFWTVTNNLVYLF